MYKRSLVALAAVVVSMACTGEVGALSVDETENQVPANGNPKVDGTNEPGNGVVLTGGTGGGTEGVGGGYEIVPIGNGGGDETGAGGGDAAGGAGGTAGGSAGGSASGAGGGMVAGAGGGTTTGGTGGGAPAAVAFSPGPQGCTAMTLEPGVDLGGYVSDRYSWKDSNCQPRSAALVRNNTQDPGGSYGGYLREMTWQLNGSTVVARGTNTNTYNGWGYVVNHYGSSSVSSKRSSGTYRTVFSGAHHAIHEFKVRLNPGGPLDATVHWFFASGRSSPTYFITYDMTAAGPNAIAADSRAPYGDMAFEGTKGPIGGVAWGDKYRFTTTASPVTPSTGWDYTQPNKIPFVRMWSQNTDAEMGAVQTESFDQKPAGGDYSTGRLAGECWGKTSASMGSGCHGSGWTMPETFLWPFQLNQYELSATNSSHRLAWGTTYGALGKTSYTAFGRTLSGYPTVSYSVMLTMGPKTQSTTMAQVTQVERMLAAQVTGGTYDPSFGVWRVAMVGNQGDVRLNAAGGPVEKPIFRFTGFTGTAPTRVTLDGQPTSNYFASVDASTQTLWVTLNGTVTGNVMVHVE